jgi:tyrosyl-tRNA synthetase
VPSATVMVDDVPTVLDLFVRVGLVKSKGEAKRLADQGGTYVNGERVTGATAVRDVQRLADSHLLLRKGARDYAVVQLEG